MPLVAPPSPSCTVTLAVALAVSALLAAPAGATRRVAMMPLAAESLLPGARDDLEQAVLDAIAALGHEVQPMSDTRAQIEEGVRTGLDCTLLEDDCAVRVGLVADVDVVVLSAVEVLERALVFRAAWLEVQGERRRSVTGAFSLPAVDGGASLRNLVSLLVTGEGEPVEVPITVELDPPEAVLTVNGRVSAAGTLWLQPGRHVLRAQLAGRQPVEEVVDLGMEGRKAPVLLALPGLPPERPFPVGVAAGAGLGITGGIVALGGGAVAVLIDASLGDVLPREERSLRQSYGRAAVVVSAAAALLALGGAGLTVGLAPPAEGLEALTVAPVTGPVAAPVAASASAPASAPAGAGEGQP